VEEPCLRPQQDASPVSALSHISSHVSDGWCILGVLVAQGTYPPMAASLVMFRKPKRINVTVPELLLEELQQIADYEGRSLSSLCCHLLETGAEQRKGRVKA
jgi:CopG-like RHH_1 or ribbon-helix-helix domain, RHH_5